MISLKRPDRPTLDPIMLFFSTSFHPTLSIVDTFVSRWVESPGCVSFFFWLFRHRVGLATDVGRRGLKFRCNCDLSGLFRRNSRSVCFFNMVYVFVFSLSWSWRVFKFWGIWYRYVRIYINSFCVIGERYESVKRRTDWLQIFWCYLSRSIIRPFYIYSASNYKKL